MTEQQFSEWINLMGAIGAAACVTFVIALVISFSVFVYKEFVGK